MNIYDVTLEYTVIRKVQIISQEPLTVEQIEQKAKALDATLTYTPEDMPAPMNPVIHLLKNSACEMIDVQTMNYVLDLKEGIGVIERLIALGCFAPDGRLGVYPNWLNSDIIHKLTELKLLRREAGSLENYQHVSYYISSDV